MSNYEALGFLADAERPVSVEFLVLPGVSLMTLACSAEPLRSANRVAGQRLFDWRFTSLDGAPPQTSSGIAWPVDGRFEVARPRTILAIIAGFWASEAADRGLAGTVHRAARRAKAVIGIESGAWVMARAGLLDGRAATTHWEDFEEFGAAFPAVDLRPDRYVVDGRLITTSGASPTFDLMIDLTRQIAGPAAAVDVARSFIYEASRGAGDMQARISFGPPGNEDERLVRAVRAMEEGIDRPVTVAAIARRVGLSARGLELLFARETGQTPGAYFLTLRLNAARRLVLDTRLALTDVASRTGFSSVGALSRAYRKAFGEPPSRSRASVSKRAA
ncbi:MAG: GlxA family transcriptional regulator [Brucellaceae bacterium]|nr:GlxA family transcriptional regulator [Brucellaceae bacterium]